MTFSHTGMHTVLGGGWEQMRSLCAENVNYMTIILAYHYLYLSTKTTQSSHRSYSRQADENSKQRT